MERGPRNLNLTPQLRTPIMARESHTPLIYALNFSHHVLPPKSNKRASRTSSRLSPLLLVSPSPS